MLGKHWYEWMWSLDEHSYLSVFFIDVATSLDSRMDIFY
jgi:hypothetical protein